VRFPLDEYRITSYFSSAHSGIDLAPKIAGTTGVPCFAPEGGKVVSSSYNAALEGNYVILQGNSGMFYYFGHFAERRVAVGDVVSEGQTIGILGSTGLSTGIHTHHEVRTKRNSTFAGYQQLDPEVYYRGEGGSMVLNLATARILGYAILGRLNSFEGAFDADYNVNHVGKDIGEKVDEFWASDEGQAWRVKIGQLVKDSLELPVVTQQLGTATNALAIVQEEAEQLRADNKHFAEEVADLSLTNDSLIKQIQDQTAEIDTLKLELDEAQLPHLVTWSSIWADIKSMFKTKE
jgi:hypothetical protein